MKKRIISLIIILSMTFTGMAQPDLCRGEEKSDTYQAYIENPLQSQRLQVGTDYIPMPIDEKSQTYKGIVKTGTPSRYMNTLSQVTAKYPSVKDQDPKDKGFGTCWAFASTAMAEFDMINNAGKSKSIDYSELQLAYFAYHSEADPLGGTSGDVNTWNLDEESGNYLEMGGNYYVAMRTYANWIGATNESLVPYSSAEKVLSNGVNKKYAYGYNQATLRNVYIYSMLTQKNDIKAAIMKYGAVGISYFASDGSTYMEVDSPYKEGEKVATHFIDYSIRSNHAVAVIGWDDDFPADRFMDTPAGDGAWLVRNSWSNNNNDTEGNAYFWLSYYDRTISQSAYAFDFESAGEYQNNYQYDGGYLAGKTNADTAANIFTAKDSKHGETIKAVMISTTEDEEVEYTIQIYTRLKNSGTNPTDGTLVSETIGRTTYAGMYTIPLSKAVKVGAKEKFAVVVKLKNSGIDAEYSYNAEKQEDGLSTKTVSKSGQSMYYSGGKWRNKKNGNFCIKAFTVNNNADTFSVKYVLNGGTNSYKNPHYIAKNNKSAKLYNPTRKGYIFAGWYKDSKYKYRTRTIPAKANRVMTLRARWMKNTKPKLKSAKSTKSGIRLSWKKLSGASMYYVYRKTGNGSWKKVKTTKSLGWTDKKVSKGKVYTYKICAHCADGNSKMSVTKRIKKE